MVSLTTRLYCLFCLKAGDVISAMVATSLEPSPFRTQWSDHRRCVASRLYDLAVGAAPVKHSGPWEVEEAGAGPPPPKFPLT